MDVETGDRLSSLPDELIHKILSFISIKKAIETSTLSSRWRCIWTSLPHLNFSMDEFFVEENFSKFVANVLSRRNTYIDVSNVTFIHCGRVYWGLWQESFISRELFIETMKYALSHNVQEVIVTSSNTIGEFPLLLSSSQSLKHLTLVGRYEAPIYVTSAVELPVLTTLYLQHVKFDNVITDKRIGIFSKCPNLKNLTLNQCRLSGSDGANIFHIYHPGLSDLTLENSNYFSDHVLNVVTPQLQNLTIREWSSVHLVSAPELVSLYFEGFYLLQISQFGFSSLEKANLCIYRRNLNHKLSKTDRHKVVVLLQKLRNAKSLTLNMDIIWILSTSLGLISRQPSPFENLKNLKIYPDTYLNVQETIPTEVRKYLLDGSPGAICTMVSFKEIQALNNAISAEKRMADLQGMLEKEKANMYRSNARMDVAKKQQQVENQHAVKMQPAEIMAEMKSCWKDVGAQIDQGNNKIHLITSELRIIEELFQQELPASKMYNLQARFSSLRVEADTVVKKIIECIKIQHTLLSVCFQPHSTTSQLSS